MVKNVFFKRMSLLGAVVTMLLGSSCTGRFSEWNTNPHEATKEMMEKDNLTTGSYFVQMQKNVVVLEQLPAIGGSVYQEIQNLAGDIYSGYMGACGTWYNGSNNTTYNLSVKWKDAAFERGFVGVMSAWRSLVEKATEFKQPHVVALATIVKVQAMHRITDMYGPIPYINFGKGSAQGVYDSQAAVYAKFFEELNTSINVLTDFYNKDREATIMGNYDFVYRGNVESWIKFANTLKLRLAMRIFYVNKADAEMFAQEAVNHPIGVMTAASDIAQLNHSQNLSYRHPLFIVGYGEFNDCRMGATIDSYMNGYSDPRISSYFKLSTAGKYTGIRTGINIIREEYAVGAPFSDLNINSSSNLVWMNPAEAYFLRAEGAVRGWTMGDTEKNLYETGIKTSFVISGASNVENYLADDTKVPAAYTDPKRSSNNSPALSTITIKWDEGATEEIKLERIITQKWLAIFPDGQEAWSEFRRTGYPKIFPVVINNSGGTINTDKQIRRIPFPSTEYRDNLANVTQAVTLLGGEDNGGTPLWWDKK